MRNHRTRILGFALCALIVMTGATMAVARAGMSMNGTFLLCIGAETVSVNIGPDGRPETGAHVCADCLIGAVADTAAAPTLMWPQGTSRVGPISFNRATVRGLAPTPSARAPPAHLA